MDRYELVVMCGLAGFEGGFGMARLTKRHRDIIVQGTQEECEYFICSLQKVEVEVLDRLHSDTSDQWIYIVKPVLKD